MIEEPAQLDTAALPIEEAIRGLRAEDFDDKDLVKGTAEDFEEDEDEDGEGVEVHLGFIGEEKNPLFAAKDWRDWDGGRVGNRPQWLDSVNVPGMERLACSVCGDPLKFLLQIYCPLDEPDDAFHRALYIFCCRKAKCVAGGSVKCVRSQLNRKNPFHLYEPNETVSSPSTPTTTNTTLCALCGCRGPLCCSACKKSFYCSKIHQRADWKRHRTTCSAADSSGQVEPPSEDGETPTSAWLYPEFSLEVEPEELHESIKLDPSTSIAEDAITPGGKDEEEDANLTQSQYDEALGSESTDPAYIRFLTRVKLGGTDQVMRYCRWNGSPLAISSDVLKEEYRPATCEHCGAERKFEFQVMPQLLHFLKTERQTTLTPSAEAARLLQNQEAADAEGGMVFRNARDEDIDFGTLDVYTCTASCSLLGVVEEVVRIQAPISLIKQKKLQQSLPEVVLEDDEKEEDRETEGKEKQT